MANYTSVEDLIKRGGYSPERAKAIWEQMVAKRGTQVGTSERGSCFLAQNDLSFEIAGLRYELRQGEVCFIAPDLVNILIARDLPLVRVREAPGAPEGRVIDLRKPLVTDDDEEPDEDPYDAMMRARESARPRAMTAHEERAAEFERQELEKQAQMGVPGAREALLREGEPAVPAADAGEDPAAAALAVATKNFRLPSKALAKAAKAAATKE